MVRVETWPESLSLIDFFDPYNVTMHCIDRELQPLLLSNGVAGVTSLGRNVCALWYPAFRTLIERVASELAFGYRAPV